MQRIHAVCFALPCALLFAQAPLANNAETANKSNNPLNLAPGLNLQDYYTPSLYDSNAHSNELLVRGTLPLAAGDFLPVPQLLRATLPRQHPPRSARWLQHWHR